MRKSFPLIFLLFFGCQEVCKDRYKIVQIIKKPVEDPTGNFSWQDYSAEYTELEIVAGNGPRRIAKLGVLGGVGDVVDIKTDCNTKTEEVVSTTWDSVK